MRSTSSSSERRDRRCCKVSSLYFPTQGYIFVTCSFRGIYCAAGPTAGGRGNGNDNQRGGGRAVEPTAKMFIVYNQKDAILTLTFNLFVLQFSSFFLSPFSFFPSGHPPPPPSPFHNHSSLQNIYTPVFLNKKRQLGPSIQEYYKSF